MLSDYNEKDIRRALKTKNWTNLSKLITPAASRTQAKSSLKSEKMLDLRQFFKDLEALKEPPVPDYKEIFREPDWKSDYERYAQEIAQLVESKQLAYGNSFGKSGSIMAILYPDGIKPYQIHDALTVVRILDKLFRIANQKDAFGESPWKDIMGYALLAVVRDASKISSRTENRHVQTRSGKKRGKV